MPWPSWSSFWPFLDSPAICQAILTMKFVLPFRVRTEPLPALIAACCSCETYVISCFVFAISRHFHDFCILNRIKGFQMVLTTAPRNTQKGPRSTKSPPRPDLLSERGVYSLLWPLMAPYALLSLWPSAFKKRKMRKALLGGL